MPVCGVRPNWMPRSVSISIFASGQLYLARCRVPLEENASLIHANRTETSAAEVVCAASPDQTMSIQSIIWSLFQLFCFTKSQFLFFFFSSTQPASKFLPCLPLWLCFIDTPGINLYLL